MIFLIGNYPLPDIPVFLWEIAVLVKDMMPLVKIQAHGNARTLVI
jgi:hypothetical protein